MTGAWLDRAIAVVLAATALAVWPSADRPFSDPKTIVLAGAFVLLVAILRADLRTVPRWLLAGVGTWLACLAASSTFAATTDVRATARDSAAIVLVVAGALLVRSSAIRTSIVITSAIVSVIAIAQWVGLDPFAVFGWSRGIAGDRMRVYATLGNPDFVAGWLGTSLWVVAAEALRRRSGASWGAVGLVVLALVGCRSFATVGVLAVSSVVFLLVSRVRAPVRAVVLLALGVNVLLVAGLGARPIRSVFEGRRYLWSVAAPHVVEAPLVGHGPGAFVLRWPAWEEAARGDAAPSRFAGPQDHAHSDPLERALDLGIPAALAIVLLSIGAVRRAIRGASSLDPAQRLVLAGAAAGVTATFVRSWVDFPLARPAELALWAVLCGLSWRLGTRPDRSLG